MAERKKWVTLSSITKKRASDLPGDAPPPKKKRLLELSEGSLKPTTLVPVEASQEEEVGAAVVDLEAETSIRVVAVLAQTLESVQEPEGMEATEVVNVFYSPVKPPPKARELKEVALVSETATGEKLAHGKILLKDEKIKRLLPKFGAPSSEGVKKSPQMVCGPALLVIPTPPKKKRKPLFPSFLSANLRNDEKKEEKGRKEEGSKMEEATKGEKEVPSLVAPGAALGTEGSGGKMEEGNKEKKRVPPTASNVALDSGETWGVLGERLFEIRREEEKILGNTSKVLEVVKSLKGKKERGACHLRRIEELEGALLQVTKHSQSDHREELGKLYTLEDKLASLALNNAEWANKSGLQGENSTAAYRM
ncbi:hypothetical protein AXF42_Ash010946 [Apostasia shenzhenica]|uniref:Uncharacterized protein n=1 Tax=Apostasia shenzhenica TaxID=1088818 RepID=A0A2H9ZQP5_9ASPA|nr:hypothetical protein AXF42_Ash010946 [Apostasia shenzhenica]